MSPDDQPELDPALADAVRRAYVRPVDEATAGRHVSAIVAASAAVDARAPVAAARPRRRAWRIGLAVAAATLVAPVGLAVAGVALPDAVEQPYRSVGISLPHQASDVTPAPPAPALRPLTAPTPTTPATARPLAPSAPTSRPQSGRGRAQPTTPPGLTGRPKSGRGRAQPKARVHPGRLPSKAPRSTAPRSRVKPRGTPQVSPRSGGTKPRATPRRSTPPAKSRAPRG